MPNRAGGLCPAGLCILQIWPGASAFILFGRFLVGPRMLMKQECSAFFIAFVFRPEGYSRLPFSENP